MSSDTKKHEAIRAVVDRVLWTAGATDWNKQMLTEAIAEAVELVEVRAERERCSQVCREIGERHQQEEGTYAAGKKAGAFECAEHLLVQ